MNHPNLLRRLSRLCLLGVFVCTLALAQDVSKRSYDIPADAADKALKAFSEQSGHGLLITSETAQGIRTRAIKGDYTAREALDAMLFDSGLVASQDAKSGAYVVRKESPVEAKNVSRAIAESGRPDRVGKTEVDEKGEPVVKLDTFEVFGRKTLNMDIRRSENDPQPYVIFSREALTTSGAVNLDDFLRKNLTSAAVSQPFNVGAAIFGNKSNIDLGGLGNGQTLILVDGRRLPEIYSSPGNSNQPSFDGIPISAIERVEVLRSTASGIYGGGATGGVINIIMRRDYTNVDTTLSYGGTMSGGGERRRIDVAAGASDRRGRTNLMVVASYSDAAALLVGDRDLLLRGKFQAYANSPETFPNTLGATTNISSTATLTLKPQYGGASLGSTRTFVPYGYQGPASDNGAGLVANAGRFNLDLAQTKQTGSAFYPISPESRVQSAMATLRRTLTPRLDGFLEGSYTDTWTSFPRSTILQQYNLPASAQSNPFNQAITVTVPAGGETRPFETHLASSRVAGGFTAKLTDRWLAGVDYTWGRAVLKVQYGGADSFDSVLGTSTIAIGAANVFRDVNIYPIDLSQAVIPGGTPQVTTQTDQYTGTLRLGGPLPKLLWGIEPRLSTVLEMRKQTVGDFLGNATQRTAGVPPTRNLFPSVYQAVNSGYAEITLPIIPADRPHRYAKSFELQLAVRNDHYETEGASFVPVDPVTLQPTAPITRIKSKLDSINPTVAFSYKPSDNLMFRGSYATGFVAPTTGQLVPGATGPLAASTAAAVGITDPLRGNEPVGTSAPASRSSGGNPDLLPELSKSWTGGLVFTPRQISGLRISLDWTQIKKRDAIGSLGLNNLLIPTLLAAMPNRITRATPAPGDPYPVGPITFLDTSSVNLATTETEALDLSLEYPFKTARAGVFTVSTRATKTIQSKVRPAPVTAELENVGVLNSTLGVLKYRQTASLKWKWRSLAAEWTTTYYDAYFLNQSHTYVAAQNSAKVPRQLFHDLYVGWDMNLRTGFILLDRLGTDSSLRLGITNVFNTRPEFDATAFNQQYFSAVGDPRLASYYLTFRKSWR